MAIKDDKGQRKVRMDRREALTCMTWAGTGLLWTLSGGLPFTTDTPPRQVSPWPH